MAIICDFCKKSLSSQGNLTVHQKSAKYCLLKQQKAELSQELICGCGKNFAVRRTLEAHVSKCLHVREAKHKNELAKRDSLIAKLHSDLIEKDRLLQDLRGKFEAKSERAEIFEGLNTASQECIKEIAKQPRTSTTTNNTINRNNYINNLAPITEEHLKDQARFLTKEHVKDGIDGYARYALDFPFKDKLACVDVPRRKIKYKDDTGAVVEDYDLIALARKMFGVLKDRNDEHIRELLAELSTRMFPDTNSDCDLDDEGKREMDLMNDRLMEELSRLMESKHFSIDLANGNIPDKYGDFVRPLCKSAAC
jgi:hypothetical protein